MLRQLSFILVILMLGCRTTREETMRSEGGRQEQMRPADPGPGIPPDHCRIVGTVVSINDMMAGNADDPCSKVPCIAVIRVEEILGYGSAFTSPLSQGKEVTVQFRYTVGPTKELFPKMSPELPGLKVGSKFQADVQSSAVAVVGESKGPDFSVGAYKLR